MHIGEVQRTEFIVKDLGDVVGDESQMARKQIRRQLRHFPTWQIRMPTVMERVIIPDRLGQWLEQVRSLEHRLDVALRIAVENNARLGGNRPFVISS